MPTGNDPPPVKLSGTVFSALKAMTYVSANKAFRDASNNLVYLFVETDGNGSAQWFYGTNTEGAENPRGEIPSDTADVISDGTYNSQTFAIAYDGSNYKIRLERDGNGVPVAKAYIV